MVRSRRNLVSSIADSSGFTGLVGIMPEKPMLLVLNYHRVGNPDKTAFDPGVFSATADDFAQQVRYLKKTVDVVGLEQVVSIVNGVTKLNRTVVLITFDDGYLDNYEIATPILAAEGIEAVFFLATSFVGTSFIPIWDIVAYIVRQSRKTAFETRYPFPRKFDIQVDGLYPVIEQVLQVYIQRKVEDEEQFIADLEQACESKRPNDSHRCFVNWDEAQAMRRAGMTLGSHTHNHRILSTLTEAEQHEELATSKQILEERLKTPIRSIAYPVGQQSSFNKATRDAAKKAGYQVAFSFYGGFNMPDQIDRFNVRRFNVSMDIPLQRFRFRIAMAKATGKLWF